ncbi:MAG: phosphoadenylyl-sulfate reductase [Phycisphaerales bacterium]
MHLPVNHPPPEPRERELVERTPREIVAWALRRFADRRLVITTGFGMEGCALIDMIATERMPIEISYLDTHFLFPETLALRDRLVERYPHLRFVNRGTPLTPEEQARDHGPELWRRDPDACCRIRKIEPMRSLMHGADAWMTAVRREQSAARSALAPAVWDWAFDVVKISPLVSWSREQIWEYVQANGVPFNPLHQQGYPSIGCVHCTQPVEGARPEDYSRAGRWAGTQKTECGLHIDPATGHLRPRDAGANI